MAKQKPKPTEYRIEIKNEETNAKFFDLLKARNETLPEEVEKNPKGSGGENTPNFPISIGVKEYIEKSPSFGVSGEDYVIYTSPNRNLRKAAKKRKSSPLTKNLSSEEKKKRFDKHKKKFDTRNAVGHHTDALVSEK
jgi:hypothetical protein